MLITKDMLVIIEYTVRLEDGVFVKGDKGPVSLNFVVGYGQVLPGLEKRLLGLSEGDEAEFMIPAREAFGEYDRTQIRTKTYDEFPEGRPLQAGRWAVATSRPTMTQYSYFIKEKTETSITLDYNHPLAGKDLHYRVKIVHVRPALPEELQFLRPCEHSDPEESTDALQPS